ncbi:barstar family protein [Streptomyces sp. P17]|uniref:barstar family protein n=1 Tax=Streptomyces sp. P17 TaxID=3074716 RepID=UPI0028F41993|nr:barstar family protein [Streptomyces sp. P17]MDT9701086.1 barstar family protein [Streptomyces sp. P17]
MTDVLATLDLAGVTDKAGLMDRCLRDLGLPDYFGRNWDALADVLSDPGLWPEGAVVIVVRNWQSYAKERPDEWGIAREVFSGASAVTVALALGGSS